MLNPTIRHQSNEVRDTTQQPKSPNTNGAHLLEENMKRHILRALSAILLPVALLISPACDRSGGDGSQARIATTGKLSSFFIKPDGSLWAWGGNNDGQLGLGDTTYRNAPVQVGAAKDWKAVSAGKNYTMALKKDGSLWAWGRNEDTIRGGDIIGGWLGLGDTENRSAPAQVGTAVDWEAVSAGVAYTMALKKDGSLWAWGVNSSIEGIGGGQLGFGDIKDRNAPAQVGTAKDWVAVSVGILHTVALKADGTLWAWGLNSAVEGISGGQLGLGDTKNRSTPVQVGSAKDWKAVAAGFYSVALKKDGSLWAWGDNKYGELGLGDTENRNVPTQVGTAKDWVAVSASGFHTVALKADGSLWAWGLNGAIIHGDDIIGDRLGLGDTENRNTPAQVGTAKDWVAVSAGMAYTVALKKDGSLWAWGLNKYGELGLGDTEGRNAPVQIKVL